MTQITQTTDPDAWVCPLGDDAGLAFATIWDDKLEVQLKVPAEDTKFQYLDVATATTLHAWLGQWLAAHAPATGEGRAVKRLWRWLRRRHAQATGLPLRRMAFILACDDYMAGRITLDEYTAFCERIGMRRQMRRWLR